MLDSYPKGGSETADRGSARWQCVFRARQRICACVT